jgi:hypothetical protein
LMGDLYQELRNQKTCTQEKQNTKKRLRNEII